MIRIAVGSVRKKRKMRLCQPRSKNAGEDRRIFINFNLICGYTEENGTVISEKSKKIEMNFILPIVIVFTTLRS